MFRRKREVEPIQLIPVALQIKAPLMTCEIVKIVQENYLLYSDEATYNGTKACLAGYVTPEHLECLQGFMKQLGGEAEVTFI